MSDPVSVLDQRAALAAADRLLSEKEAALFLNISVHAMRMWRYASPARGPAWVKLGTTLRARVRYRMSALEAFLTASTVAP